MVGYNLSITLSALLLDLNIMKCVKMIRSLVSELHFLVKKHEYEKKSVEKKPWLVGPGWSSFLFVISPHYMYLLRSYVQLFSTNLFSKWFLFQHCFASLVPTLTGPTSLSQPTLHRTHGARAHHFTFQSSLSLKFKFFCFLSHLTALQLLDLQLFV